jgi:hypothetical protein
MTVLVELGLVEQCFQAVLEVPNERGHRHGCDSSLWGDPPGDHGWRRRYASSGLAGLADQSSKPASCPHQMGALVEARIVALRRANPGWGPASGRGAGAAGG